MENTFVRFIMPQRQELTHSEVDSEVERAAGYSALRVESIGKVPAMEFRQLTTGQILFRYAIDETTAQLGFDGVWREMSAYDQRQTLLIGGRVAEWLKSLSAKGVADGQEKRSGAGESHAAATA